MSQDDPHADVAAWLRAHRDAWNADDVPAMFASVSPDLHWVNVVGMHWQGEAAVVAAHQAFFKVMFEGVRLDLVAIESVVVLDADTRIAVVEWALGDYTTPGGERIRAERNRMTLVFSGQGVTLQLRHVANVRIDAAAAAHDPVRA
ncbi:MAG: hypothetical protein DI570_15265 [Phenylobacterium zucineum]|nr:MAG: hypothetical protein DI570_15265 [Phenylobacterium zucineum]